jgi:exodeoxyribonuclease VII small subunit
VDDDIDDIDDTDDTDEVDDGVGGAAPTSLGAGDGVDDDLVDLGYADALHELEALLADLERDDVDVDVLGPKVRRAAALIRVCRAHIGAARVDIERIVVDLDDPASDG